MDTRTREIPALSVNREEALADYRVGWRSRHISLIGRREVLTGKAKFGIFGDGKEVPQLAMARAFEPGDIRSGYYRDQTFMLATGLMTVDQFFAQLYAIPDLELEPQSVGRQMNAHFASRVLDDNGAWKNLAQMPWTSADISPTAGQMPRLAGLAYASRIYRELDALSGHTRFSNKGREIAFGTIGNASCAEGPFWETINAIGVLQAPMLLSIWDDGYGISVPNEFQITKGDLSAVLSGFQRMAGDTAGYDLYTVKGWDYAALCQTYKQAAALVREEHVPAILHITEITQPQGHSTSGSHERYKSKEQLEWERKHDCLLHMRQWLLDEGYADEATLETIEKEEGELVRTSQRRMLDALTAPVREDIDTVIPWIRALAPEGSEAGQRLETLGKELQRQPTPMRRHVTSAVKRALFLGHDQPEDRRRPLIEWIREQDAHHRELYSSHLHSQSPQNALAIEPVALEYADDSPDLRGFEVLNHCFKAALERHPELIAFGEDVGALGDVNQGFVGLQKMFGPLRVADTGIRECTILGQAIGMAMRGLRPLCEIQYLDYILYALQIISDDLATLQYRTRGGQKAPVIVRTRGHRLEGVWHSGSPMGAILHLVRGVYVCVPRDMTRAAGFYNTLLRSDESAIVVEVLNGYRLKEKLPSNIDRFSLPLGEPEVLRSGADVTLVTYGACCRIALEAAERLAEMGIDLEVIDVQTLLPFDLTGTIGASLRRTNRIVFLDEDVPGGATAFMMQEVIEKQDGYHWLDAPPRTLTAQPHRPAYGSDGDYWSKPNAEQVFETVYELMHEADPKRFPIFYR